MSFSSPASILEEIRTRHAASLPLNLTAVREDAPGLLEGLWDPARFMGWRQRLDEAGVDYTAIHFRLAVNLECPVCGHRDTGLARHYFTAHSLTTAEVRKSHPVAESQSEEARALKFNNRHGREGLSAAPHWERAWSLEYALDRIRWLHDYGYPVNYSHLAKHEPGLAAYARRVLGSWDAALKACGLAPEAVRLTEEAQTYTREEILFELSCQHEENPRSIHIERARAWPTSSLIAAAIREFRSYDAALREAGLDPVELMPGLADPTQVAARDQFLEELNRRRRENTPYDAAEVSSFIRRHQPAVYAFWGDWPNVRHSQGWLEADLFNSPPHTAYDRPAAVIKALRERRAHGLSLREVEARVDNSSLVHMASKHCGGWSKALAAAGVERPQAMVGQRSYTAESLLDQLRALAAAGHSMSSNALSGGDADPIAFKWAVRYYGSWRAALKAAGVEQAPRTYTPPPPLPKRFTTDESVLAAIRARAALGLDMAQPALHAKLADGGDLYLVIAARKIWGSWQDALIAAGVGKMGDRMGRRRFWNKESVIYAMRDRMARGLPMSASELSRGETKDGGLAGAIKRYFGGHQAALDAAEASAGPLGLES